MLVLDGLVNLHTVPKDSQPQGIHQLYVLDSNKADSNVSAYSATKLLCPFHNTFRT